MKTTKRTIQLIGGSLLAFAVMIPAAASAQTRVVVGINVGGLFAQPPVEVYSAPAYYPPARGYYQRPAYYAPRVVYGEPQVIYSQRWHRDWDNDQRGDWRRGWDRQDDRNWHRRDDHDWHHHRHDRDDNGGD